MKPPLVSILMATRDESPVFLKSAVESIKAQTYPYWEFLILDDGSKTEDNFHWLCAQSAQDKRIKVYRGKGVGLAVALNELLEKAEGDYFARMDSDDWSYPQRIHKEILYLLRNPDTVLVGTWIRIVDDAGKTIHFSCKPDYIRPPWSRAAHSTWCGRTSVLRKIGGYSKDFPVSQDYDCWLRMIREGRVGMVEELLLDYRWGRISSQRYDEQIKYFLIANQLQHQREKGEAPDIQAIQQRLKKYHLWYHAKFKAQTFAQIGMRYWQQGKYREAQGLYLKSLLSFPFDLGSWVYLICVGIFHTYPTHFIQLFRVRTMLRKMMFVNPSRSERAISLVDSNAESKKIHKIALIIPTMNRPHLLRRLLASVVQQQHFIEQIIIVDAGIVSPGDLRKDFSILPLEYYHVAYPSLTSQRNFGIERLKDTITLVCFLDDDIVLEKDALKAMVAFWDESDVEVGGAACNIVNVGRGKKNVLSTMKKLFLTGGSEQGKVLRSGYGLMLSPVDKEIFTDWIFGGATFWRREVFRSFRFDEWFSGYGFGEDLDFSFRVSRIFKLAVLPQSRVQHLKEDEPGNNHFDFGVMQIVNRYYFVHKHRELSKYLFIWASVGQILENIIFCLVKRNLRRSYAYRTLGNAYGCLQLLYEGFMGHAKQAIRCS